MYIMYHICLSKHTHIPIWVLCKQIYTHMKVFLILCLHIGGALSKYKDVGKTVSLYILRYFIRMHILNVERSVRGGQNICVYIIEIHLYILQE